jgi:SH3-like domain-containing protein
MTAALVTGSEIHAGPDAATATIATLAHLTPACVGTVRQASRFRRVLLTDGTDGFVDDSYIADLTRPVAPPRPTPVPAVASAPARMTADDCSPLLPAFLEKGAAVHAGPDAQSRILVWLDAATPVCVAPDAKGFSMRRVRLPDAREGFVKESDLSR